MAEEPQKSPKSANELFMEHYETIERHIGYFSSRFRKDYRCTEMECEDMQQDIRLHILRYIGRHDESIMPMYGYLFLMAFTAYNAVIRKHCKRKAHIIEVSNLVQPYADADDIAAVFGASRPGIAESNVVVDDIRAVIAQLTPAQRTVVQMRWSGMMESDIAGFFNVSRQTVSNALIAIRSYVESVAIKGVQCDKPVTFTSDLDGEPKGTSQRVDGCQPQREKSFPAENSLVKNRREKK